MEIVPHMSVMDEFLADLRGDIGRIRMSSDNSRYRNDPAGFLKDVLGETLTPDLEKLCESVRDNVITIAQSCNAVGKSYLSARLGLWFYLTHNQVQVYTLAAPPEDNLRRILWGEIGSVYLRHRDTLFKGHSKSGLQLYKSPLDFVSGVTIPSSGSREERVAKVSGKHRKNLMFLLDEADAIPDEIYEGVETCISGGSKVRILCMFNPRRRAGKLYRIIKSGGASVVRLSAFKHPNVLTGDDVIPGAVSRERTVFRIASYCRRLTKNEGPDRYSFKLPDYLVGTTAKRDDGTGEFAPLKPGWYKPSSPEHYSFYYMVLGKFPPASSAQLISAEWVDAAVERWRKWVDKYGEKPPGNTWGIMGADIAEMGDDSNAECIRWGPWVAQIKTWGDVDPDKTALKLIRHYKRTKILRACIDATGVGAGVAPHMLRKGCVAHSVKVANSPTKNIRDGEFRILRDQLAWDVREWLRTDKHSMLPPDSLLQEELLAWEYQNKNGKIEITKGDDIKDILGRSPDRFWSLALTFYEPDPLFENWDTRKQGGTK